MISGYIVVYLLGGKWKWLKSIIKVMESDF